MLARRFLYFLKCEVSRKKALPRRSAVSQITLALGRREPMSTARVAEGGTRSGSPTVMVSPATGICSMPG